MTIQITIPPRRQPRKAFYPRPRIQLKPISLDCICPGCYWVATEGEMCLRCTLDACTAQENHHG